MAADPLELVADLVERGIVGAAQIAYCRDGQTVQAGFGACDDVSRFALASLTKPLIAMACLVACDEGVLDLDASLTDYVLEAICRATVRELLAHASGLPADSAEARRAQVRACLRFQRTRRSSQSERTEASWSASSTCTFGRNRPRSPRSRSSARRK